MTRIFAAALLALACFAAMAQHGQQPLHQRFEDAQHWARIFDDPERDAWQKPDEVIGALKLPPDATVADLGAGTGYFSVRLARAAPQGRVYGVDVEPGMVRYLEERAAKENLANLSSHLAARSSPKLPDKVDLVLIVDTYHHLEQRIRYFRNLAGWLKPGGRIALIDFKPGAPVGPPKTHRVAAKSVVEEMGKAGYRLAAEHGFLPHQYFLVFEPR